jgi:serine/threonine protein kinase
MNTYRQGSMIFGRYEVSSRALKGGMGCVYLCYDQEDKRPVALKTFHPEYISDRTVRERFIREGTMWVGLGKDPHIVQCYNVDRVDPGVEIYLVLELIAKDSERDSASLQSWINHVGLIPIDDALLFALQIVRGMKHAVEVFPGFVHRDLKPANILVGIDKAINVDIHRLRVTDFGLANILGSESQIRETITKFQNVPNENWVQLTHGLVGTPLYMAPEQWSNRETSIRTDIYSFGCIFYEMITGRRVVDGNTIAEIGTAHKLGKIQPMPVQLNKNTKEIISTCLATDPMDRFDSWIEVETRLIDAYTQIGKKSLPIFTDVEQAKESDTTKAGWAYHDLGHSYIDIGKPQLAIDYFQQTLSIAQSKSDKKLEKAGFSSIGRAYRKLRKSDESLSSYRRAIEIATLIDDKAGEARDYANIANVYEDLGDFRKAIDFRDLALQKFVEADSQAYIAGTLNQLGNSYYFLGNYQQAIENFEAGLKIAQSSYDQWEICKALNGLGLVDREKAELERSLEYFLQALTIALEIGGDNQLLGDLFSNLATVYGNLGRMKECIQFLGKSLDIFREYDDKRKEGGILSNLGHAYEKYGDIDKAMSCYVEALKIGDETNDKYLLAITYHNSAHALLAVGELRKARDGLTLAAELFRQIGNENLAKDAEKTLNEIITRPEMNDKQKALLSLIHSFKPLIDGVIAVSKGNRNAKEQVEEILGSAKSKGWNLSTPIQLMLDGERNITKITKNLDEIETLVVTVILQQL